MNILAQEKSGHRFLAGTPLTCHHPSKIEFLSHREVTHASPLMFDSNHQISYPPNCLQEEHGGKDVLIQ